MYIYFLLIRIAALLGNQKARKLVDGQKTVFRELTDYVCQVPKEEPILWIHAASVGEFEQARPLIEYYRRHDTVKRQIVLTFFSPSGYELRKNYDMADKVLYLPFATQKNAHRFVETLHPSKVIFVKYEFWPAYLRELKKQTIPTYLISAIFRPKQLFFRPWGKWYLKLLHCFNLIFVQDEASAKLLEQHKIQHVQVVGDTRFDRVNEVMQHAKDLPKIEAFCQGKEKVIIAGSTWLQDEKLLIQYIHNRPDVDLVLVPHEIDEEHLHQIFMLWEGCVVRYTQLQAINMHAYRTLLVDTIGVLSSIYRYGHVAYVGGGFGEGIHNTLEPAVYGMPVVFGPKWQHFREAKGLLDNGAARSIHSYKELEQALDDAFANKDIMGQAADAYVKSELGTTDRIVHSIQ